MWQYNDANELYHYGVPGMRWGTRRSRESYKTAKLNYKVKRAHASDDFDTFYKRASNIPIGKAAKIARTNAAKRYDKSFDAAQTAKGKLKTARKAYKADKKTYKEKVNKPNDKYTDKQRRLDRALFNSGTEKRVNQYLNTGTTLKTARTKAYTEAGANTAAALMVMYGAYKIYSKTRG